MASTLLARCGRVSRGAGPELFAAALAAIHGRYVAGPSLRGGFPIDDAWIHMVYGLALRQGEGLAFNTDAPATGCTSPLWVVFAGVAQLLTGTREPSSGAALALKGFSLACFALSAALAARLARRCAPRRRSAPFAALAAGTIVASAPILAYASVSGMEVSLASCLMLGALLLASRRRFALAGLVAGMAALARPEAVLTLPAVASLAWLAGEGSRLKRVVAVAAVGSAPVVLDLVRNQIVSGRPLPATFYRKSHLSPGTWIGDLGVGFHEILGAVSPTSLALFWVLVAAALVVGAHAGRRLFARPRSTLWLGRALAGVAAALGLGYVAGISAVTRLHGGEVFYFERYLLPPLPLLVVGAVSALVRAPYGLERGRRLAAVAVAIAVVACLAAELAGTRHERARYATNVADTDAIEVGLGRFVRQLPAGAVVWSQDAGAIRYFGQHPTVDLNELNTPELFRGEPMPPAWRPDSVIVSLVTFKVVAARGALDQVMEVHAPSDPQSPLGAQVVLRCQPGQDGEIGVDRHGKRIAQARCARAGETRGRPERGAED